VNGSPLSSGAGGTEVVVVGASVVVGAFVGGASVVGVAVVVGASVVGAGAVALVVVEDGSASLFCFESSLHAAITTATELTRNIRREINVTGAVLPLRSIRMAEPLERMTNLLALLLETKVPLSLQQIVTDLHGQYPVNTQAQRGAFERDKAVLREIGVPIDQMVLAGDRAGQTAYWIDRHRYELAGLDLTDDERRALQMAVAAVRTDESWGREGLLKLGAGGDRPSRAVAATVPTFEALPPLREAVAAKATVRFGYRDVDRELDPYGLLLRDGYWYVIGHDHTHRQVRTYRVDRIVGRVTSGPAGSFRRPPDFDIRAVFPSDPKLLGEPESEVTRAIVRIDPVRAPLVAQEVGDDAVVARGADGSIDVEVPCVNRDAFRSWVLGLTSHAVVVEPADLRAEIVEWLQGVAG